MEAAFPPRRERKAKAWLKQNVLFLYLFSLPFLAGWGEGERGAPLRRLDSAVASMDAGMDRVGDTLRGRYLHTLGLWKGL